MDTRKLTELLRGTVDPSLRHQAEEQLQQVRKIIGFAPSLLQITMSNEVALPVRQAGVVYLKNFINEGWHEREVEPGEPLPFVIHEQDKAMIRDTIVEAVVQAPPLIKTQLCICVRTVVKHDFPEKWTQIVDKVSIYLQNPDPSAWHGALLCLYQLIKNYEYQTQEQRLPLMEAMNMLLPQMYNIIVRLLPDDSEQSVVLQKQILKCFFALIQHTLPLDLITKEVFAQWMEVMRQILDKPIPAHTLQVEEDDRCDLPWWKCKKWAVHTLSRVFERYGSPVNTRGEYVQFAEWFLSTFTGGILEVLLKILEQYRNKEYISPRVLQLTLSYIDNSVSHSHSWKLLKPHMFGIIKEVLFPLLSYSDSDEELWQSDPVEYIRIKFDIFEDYISPVTAAQTLLLSSCKKRKEMLSRTMNLCMQILTHPSAENPRQRDGALHMVGTLSDVLLKKKFYTEQLDSLIAQHVLPEFESPLGYMRARACWVLNYFSSAKFKNDQVMMRAVNLTTNALLQDIDLPVKVEAAIALQMLLIHQEKAQQILEPQVIQVIHELLNITRETEIDDLTTVMQKIVKMYPNQLSPVAVEICDHLATTFTSLLESDTSVDEKAITGMGLLTTLETLLTVMEDLPEVTSQLEKIVLKVIGLILQESVIDYYEEALSLAYQLTSKSISEDMWKVLELLYQVFETTGFDYFTDMVSVIHNYITIDTDAFLSNENRILAVFNMCKKVLNSDAEELFEAHGAKLLEVMVLQCQGRIDHCLPSFVELVLSRLTREVKTSELRTMNLQVLIAILYHNPELLFSILTKLQESVPNTSILDHFIKQWIQDTDCFLGLHDRKLSVLGLCKLLDMGPTRPPLTEEIVAKMMPSFLTLFSGLKRAYVAKAEAEDSDSDSDEDEDDESNVDEVLSSDEDEIDEMNTEYLDHLARVAVKNSGDHNVSMTATVNEDSSDDEDDEEDDIQTALECLETPLDDEDCPVDEYVVFKGVLGKLQCTEPALYQALVGPLNEEQQRALQEVLTLADQRKAQRESKSIEKRGGYNFTVPSSVPTKFKFGS